MYASTEVSGADEKEMFYAKFDSILDQFPRGALVMALEALHEEARSLGLQVSWPKTVQVFGGLLD